MQERHFRIEQNPINSRVIHVPHANLNCRQIGAPAECSVSDASDAVGYRDARQAGAGLEGYVPDAGHAFRYRDAWEAVAASEGPIPDAGDRIAFNGVGND